MRLCVHSRGSWLRVGTTEKTVTMMSSRLFAVVLVLVYAICCVNANHIDCSQIRVKCVAVDAAVCRSRGGLFIPKGGFCGYCDICPKYVGEGESCEDDNPLEPPTPTCQKPLICDPETKFCVAEQRSNSSQDTAEQE
ncbi:uncharacterized protein LOC124776026 [Schistocerca piceifrons]|uniref:uncharacterized protein LOC124776026 n=1 Tax=Schistocerca piceifrons TaxID=274613 RepID=UPI001F5EF812|nr:uncharacterized protein LOC124776026 [Schistocerca piceifrons]